MTQSYKYPCMRVIQEKDAKELLLFSASAVEIDSWVGIPQRLSLGGNETVGFQRTVSLKREDALRKFFSEDRNVMQNPLLCAIRQAPGIHVTYEPSENDADIGHLLLTVEPLETFTFLELLQAARAYLESRVPSLKDRAVPTDLIATLQGQLDPSAFADGGDGEASDLDDLDEAGEDESGEPAEEALFDESQITDFWDQVRAREEIAAKLSVGLEVESFIGFPRGMLEAYLRPIILVDGQHRLRGAVLAAEDEIDISEEAKTLILEGMSATDAKKQLMAKRARKLPVSLLMDDSPAEHVFQYVLVNQKATPVPRALLGTIISTSLAAEELATIAERLEDAKIQLEGSRIVSILARASDSPFCGLVAKGLEGEGTNKLQWSVLSSLADMFRYLQGGRLYHESTDHAKIWRDHHLAGSALVSQWQAREFQSPYDYWKDLNGPWIHVFKAFWARARDALADTSNEAAYNYWGNTRESNIFNKPSLHILSADFFSFLREQKAKIDTAEEIAGRVDDWLEYASKDYFARDWKLAGVKKDSVGTRRQWSKLWADHRQKGGKPPAPAEFVKLFKA